MIGGFKSGFVGVRREDRGFLETWGRAIDEMPGLGISLQTLKQGSRHDPFQVPDQDTFNVAALAHPKRISSLGPEGMGFAPGLTVMWHAVESAKPWVRNYIKDLIFSGMGVGNSHRRYWHYADGPVCSFSIDDLKWRGLNMKLAVMLSRLYHAA